MIISALPVLQNNCGKQGSHNSKVTMNLETFTMEKYVELRDIWGNEAETLFLLSDFYVFFLLILITNGQYGYVKLANEPA